MTDKSTELILRQADLPTTQEEAPRTRERTAAPRPSNVSESERHIHQLLRAAGYKIGDQADD